MKHSEAWLSLIRPEQEPLFETSAPAEGQLFWDVQFCQEGRWLYFAGVPRFETEQRATNWMDSFQKRCDEAGERILMRVKPTFEPYEIEGVQPERPVLPAVPVPTPADPDASLKEFVKKLDEMYPSFPGILTPFCTE